jgi:hypothetical protein
VKYALIRRHRRLWPIRVQCRMLGVFDKKGVVATSSRKPPLAEMRFCKSLILLRAIKQSRQLTIDSMLMLKTRGGGRGPFCTP